MGTLYNLCISSIIFLRTYIHNIVYIIRSVNMFNLCFGFDLAWFGKFVQTRARARVCVCLCVCVFTSIHREGFTCLEQLGMPAN